MNTIIIHHSSPHSCTSRDKHLEGLLEFVDVLCAPVWEYGYKRDPWWVAEGASSTGLQVIAEEVVTEDGEVIESDEDDETVVDAEDGSIDSGEFPLGEIDVEDQFDWAEQMMLEEDDWDVVEEPFDTSEGEWCKIDEDDDDRSVYSQDSFVICEQEEIQDACESPMDTRPTGESLLKLVDFMTKAAKIGKARRGRKATDGQN
ncbi:hypothetical protein AX15_005449 [Amanita polypyramis BW_CC]|nr:hypothetical protein AX15_005449 [Amanita polypyramis BW_CC]